MMRKLSFEAAKAQYVHRFTMEHVPAWSRSRPCDSGGTETRYCAPQYRTDREWFDNTIFPGEGHLSPRSEHCEARNQSWPLGQWLDSPYSKGSAR